MVAVGTSYSGASHYRKNGSVTRASTLSAWPSRPLCMHSATTGIREAGQTWVSLAMRLRRLMLASDILSRSSATGLFGTLPCTKIRS